MSTCEEVPSPTGSIRTVVDKSAGIAAIGLPAPPEPREATGCIGHIVCEIAHHGDVPGFLELAAGILAPSSSAAATDMAEEAFTVEESGPGDMASHGCEKTIRVSNSRATSRQRASNPLL